MSSHTEIIATELANGFELDLPSAQIASQVISALRDAGYLVVPEEIAEIVYDDEALAASIHAELKRQQQYTIGKHGVVALAEAPFIKLVYHAMITAATGARSQRKEG